MEIYNYFVLLVLVYSKANAEKSKNFTFKYVCEHGSDQLASDTGPAGHFCELWNFKYHTCPSKKTILGDTKPCTDCYILSKECPFKSELLTQEHNCSIPISVMCLQSDVTCLGVTHCDLGCSNYYLCQNGDCVARKALCDGNTCNDCDENTEWREGVGFKCVREGSPCIIPQQLLYDNVMDCDNGVDLCYPSSNQTIVNTKPATALDTKRCFQCVDDDLIIPLKLVCDGFIDCKDLSDECLCEHDVPEICRNIAMYKPLDSFMQPPQVYQCNTTQLSCGNNQCVDAFHVMCDSIGDCSDNRDEWKDYCGVTIFCIEGVANQAGQKCRCQKQGNCQVKKGTLCNKVEECPLPQIRENIYEWSKPPGYPEDECVANCPDRRGFGCTGFWFNLRKNASLSVHCIKFNSLKDLKNAFDPKNAFDSKMPTFLQREKFAYKNNMTDIPGTQRINVTKDDFCNGYIKCSGDLKDELNCSDRFYCQSGNKVNIRLDKKCNGFKDCVNGTDELNETCPHRIFCSALDGAKVSIAPDDICNYIIDCDNQSDEMNCTDRRFYCEDANKTLFVHLDEMFNGVNNCGDWSDECPSVPRKGHDNTFSSRYDLIRNPILRYLVWIMALPATVGNGVVVLYQIATIRKLKIENKPASLWANHFLVLNLAVADLLMGFYLLLLGGNGVKYSKIYCSVSLKWLTSRTCTAMGILVVLSSEASVVTLVLLSAFRMYSIYKPFETARKPSQRTVLLLISLSWGIASLSAFLPLSNQLEQIFYHKALIPKHPYFRGTVVEFEVAKMYALKLFTFNPKLVKARNMTYDQILGATKWSDLPILKNSRYFGFYSSQSVCLPKIFVVRGDRDWVYSITIISFNFVCFVFVCASHILVWYRITKQQVDKRIRRSSNCKASSDLHRKIIRLVATDFCCQVPVTIMAIINVSGFKLPNVAYAISAIVLLPINSALNPILYSNAIDKVLELCKHCKLATKCRIPKWLSR